MPVSRKTHVCTLCHEVIPKDRFYIYHKVTPWDHPDNETFGVYKAHKKCNELWVNGVGEMVDYSFPSDGNEWEELLEEAAWQA
jgi:hypothetical protein